MCPINRCVPETLQELSTKNVMGKPIYIFGAGGLGREFNAMLHTMPEWIVMGFYDDRLPAGTFVDGIKCLGLTAILMFVILSVVSGPKETGLLAGVAIGGVIAFEAMFAGPISGASMNPARSLAPAVLSGGIGDVWIYLLAPLLGAAIGVFCNHVTSQETNRVQ
jgi:glycerol uptake facilitator-like aquaporin